MIWKERQFKQWLCISWCFEVAEWSREGYLCQLWLGMPSRKAKSWDLENPWSQAKRVEHWQCEDCFYHIQFSNCQKQGRIPWIDKPSMKSIEIQIMSVGCSSPWRIPHTLWKTKIANWKITIFSQQVHYKWSILWWFYISYIYPTESSSIWIPYIIILDNDRKSLVNYSYINPI